MAILNDVKQALSVYYDEPTKNAEISNIIAGAKAFLLQAGWPSSDLAVAAIFVLYENSYRQVHQQQIVLVYYRMDLL